jgi:hypothetical protein
MVATEMTMLLTGILLIVENKPDNKIICKIRGKDLGI